MKQTYCTDTNAQRMLQLCPATVEVFADTSTCPTILLRMKRKTFETTNGLRSITVLSRSPHRQAQAPSATVSTQQQACSADSSAFQEYYCKRGDVLDDLRLIAAQSRSQHRQAYIQRKLRNMIHLSAIHISRTFPTRLSRL